MQSYWNREYWCIFLYLCFKNVLLMYFGQVQMGKPANSVFSMQTVHPLTGLTNLRILLELFPTFTQSLTPVYSLNIYEVCMCVQHCATLYSCTRRTASGFFLFLGRKVASLRSVKNMVRRCQNLYVYLSCVFRTEKL